MIPAERLGHIDRVALASDRPVLDVHVYRGIELRIHPPRGFDIGGAWFRGFPVNIGWPLWDRLPMLEPGERRETRLIIEAEVA